MSGWKGWKLFLQFTFKSCKHSAAAVWVHQTESCYRRVWVIFQILTMTECDEHCSDALMQHTHHRTCASCSVWSDPHWHRLAWLNSPSSLLVFSVVQSDLGGDHGDCVKAICGGDDWPKPELPVWRPEEMCLLLSSAGPQSLSLSLCAASYAFLLRLLTHSFF